MIGKAQFISTQTVRDVALTLPNRMLVALQVNFGSGCSPETEADDIVY
ncbi:MAG: hypothetical protein ACI9XK_003043 [Granulosicoccus sp.]|jgi:hypothetical protein